MITSRKARYASLENTAGRRWAIGDVHGHLKTLRTLVEEKIVLDKQDHLILLGDLIDRGPNSKGVLDYLSDLKTQGYSIWCIKGNHEDLFIKSAQEIRDNNHKGFWLFKPKSPINKQWLSIGGKETLDSLGAKNAAEVASNYHELIDSMYHFILYPDAFLAHAGLNFKSSEPFEDTQSMMWIRDYDIDPEIIGKRILIHGHTPLGLEFIQELVRNHKDYGFIVLDNGISKGSHQDFGHLVALELESKEIIAQKNLDSGASPV